MVMTTLNSVKDNTKDIPDISQASAKFPEELLKDLASSSRIGLSESEVKRRIELFGTNEFSRKKRFELLRKVFNQTKNPVVFILFISCILLFSIGGYVVDASVILVVLIINMVIALLQENKASRAFSLLRKVPQWYIQVRRDGRRIQIKSKHLVPGDIVFFESGDSVPADIRIFEQKNLEVNESMLTGEWKPVRKEVITFSSPRPITEQVNMIWAGTTIVSGSGSGIVVATGEYTFKGSIAKHLRGEEGKTPLSLQIQKVAQIIMIFVMISVLGIMGVAWFLNIPPIEIIITSVAIAVAGIPSGLPATITVVLAVGMRSILKNNGLVRNMLAAETLGSTTWVLTDKTGTLTSGEMKISKLIMFREHVLATDNQMTPFARSVIFNAYLTTNGKRVIRGGEEDSDDEVVFTGTPIDQAIIVACENFCPTIPNRDRRVAHRLFSSEKKYADALVLSQSGEMNYYIVGAPEKILEQAETVYHNGKRIRLTTQHREYLNKEIEREGSKGKRIIAFGMARIPADEVEQDHGFDTDSEYYQELLKTHGQEIIFTSLLLFEDPIRTDVFETIKYVRKSDIKITMVTGDSEHTALYIAKRTGIVGPRDADKVINGYELEGLSDEELFLKAQNVRVFARMLPDQKTRLLRVLLARKEVVAMTGDGVNDAPALHAASIGIAVASGTDVAKEAADLILLKNSFSTIAAGIVEGKKIIQNLKKIVIYLLSTSFSEVILVAGGLLITGSLPITAVQILWANIVEEAFIAFAFAFEKSSGDTSQHSPRESRGHDIIDRSVRYAVTILAVAVGLFLLALYGVLSMILESEEQIRTIMFLAVSIDSMFLALSLKSLNKSIFRTNIFNNLLLIAAIGISVVILLVAFMTPALSELLSLAPIPTWALLVIPISGIFHITVIEGIKMVVFKKRSVSRDTVVQSGTRK